MILHSGEKIQGKRFMGKDSGEKIQGKSDLASLNLRESVKREMAYSGILIRAS